MQLCLKPDQKYGNFDASFSTTHVEAKRAHASQSIEGLRPEEKHPNHPRKSVSSVPDFRREACDLAGPAVGVALVLIKRSEAFSQK